MRQSRIRRSVQRALGNTQRPMAVSYGLIGGIAVFGLLGYVLDSLLYTGPWLMLGGILTGLVLGFYALASLISHP